MERDKLFEKINDKIKIKAEKESSTDGKSGTRFEHHSNETQKVWRNIYESIVKLGLTTKYIWYVKADTDDSKEKICTNVSHDKDVKYEIMPKDRVVHPATEDVAFSCLEYRDLDLPFYVGGFNISDVSNEKKDTDVTQKENITHDSKDVTYEENAMSYALDEDESSDSHDADVSYNRRHAIPDENVIHASKEDITHDDYATSYALDEDCTDDSQKEDETNVDSFFHDQYETQVLEGGEEDLDKYFSSCEKNPISKTKFIPINDFKINDLPEEYRDDDLVKYIKPEANLTVRVAVKITSTKRPEFWPRTNKPYPFFEKRGSDLLRVGTGMIWSVNIFTDGDDKGTCKCHKCQHSDRPSKRWGEVTIFTATQMVFDDFEARDTSCKLVNDRQDISLLPLDGWMMVAADIEEDRCMLENVTCDKDLLDKLNDMLDILEKFKNVAVTVKISHGNPKPVSVGQKKQFKSKTQILISRPESPEDNEEEHVLTLEETRAPRRKELTISADENSKSYYEQVLNDVVLNVNHTWQAVKDITGYDFGIVPPMCLSPRQEVGHWINLSIGIVPFDYVTKNAEIINENKDGQGGKHNIKLNSLTSALLITEFLKSVIEQMEMEANDEQEDVKYILKELYTLLQSLMKDLDLFLSTKTTEKLFSTMSKMKGITKNLLHISKVNEINQSTPTVRLLTVTECDLLCRILSLEPEFAHKMIDINDTMVLHRSPLYFIETVLEDEMEEKVRNRSNQDESDLKSDLSLLGFSQEKSQEIANSINSNFHNMHSPIYWAKLYLEDVFSTDPLINMMPIFDKYADKPFDTWFNDEADLRSVVKDPPQKHHFQTIKFRSDDPNNVVTSELVATMFQDADNTLLFHGAKHANGLHNILKRGIEINNRGSKLDFSNGSGFYMSDDFKAAKDWALKRINRPSAVIIFRVPNNLLVFGDTEGLDLSIDRDKWSAVVIYHRTDYEVDDDVPDSVKSNTLKFIKGPVCQNGFPIESRRSNDPIPYKIDGREVQQYCIRHQHFANQISSCIVGVLLYNVPDN